jgi:hypothetical protein
MQSGKGGAADAVPPRDTDPSEREKDHMEFISKLSWGMLIIACLTLGLAPFTPPHIWEKLQMLFKGELVRPIDWFDLVLHGAPWVLLILKAIVSLTEQ